MLDKLNNHADLISGGSTFLAFIAVIVVAHYDRRATRRTQRASDLRAAGIVVVERASLLLNLMADYGGAVAAHRRRRVPTHLRGSVHELVGDTLRARWQLRVAVDQWELAGGHGGFVRQTAHRVWDETGDVLELLASHRNLRRDEVRRAEVDELLEHRIHPLNDETALLVEQVYDEIEMAERGKRPKPHSYVITDQHGEPLRVVGWRARRRVRQTV